MARKFLNSIDLAQNELLNAKIQLLASDPGSPANGQVWVNTTSHTLKIRLNGVTVSLGRLDQISAPTGSIDGGNQRYTNLADPTSAQDSATKAYVDAAIVGLDLREAVRVCATTNGTLASAFANGQTVDGVTLATGDRILLTGQSTGSENGAYTVNASGAPTRATDFDVSAEMDRGVLFPVEQGTANRGLFMHTTTGTITVGTTALTFAKIGPTSGGSPTRYAADIGNGSNTTIDVAHNLGTSDPIVQLYDKNSPANKIDTDTSVVDANTVRLIFATAPTSNQYRVVVL